MFGEGGEKPALPPGWAWAELDELCVPVETINPARDYACNDSIRYVDLGAISNHKIRSPQIISAKKAPSRARQRIAAGDTLFSCVRVYLENIAIVPDELDRQVASTAFAVLRPAAGIDPEYLYWLVRHPSFIRAMTEKQRGNSPPAVLESDVKAAPVPVAPASEQRRIVARIGELFGEIEAGEQELEKAREGLADFRRAVLKAAVTGELTREWREKNPPNETGADFLARILAERRAAWERAELARLKAKGKAPKGDSWKLRYVEPTPPDAVGLPELPQGWTWASMDQLLAEIKAGQNFKCDERPPEPEEVGIVKVSAVTWGEFDESASKTITDSSRIDLSLQIREGDFLFSRANTLELVGAPVVVRSITRTLLLSDKVLRFQFAVPLENWIYHVLRSPWGRREIEGRSTGNQLSMRNITQESIRRIRVPLPPFRELKELEKRVGEQLTAAAQTAAELRSHARDVHRLRQSILSVAFAGKLTSRSPGDEPAGVLLERMAVAKATPPVARRARSIGSDRVSVRNQSRGRPRGAPNPAEETLS